MSAPSDFHFYERTFTELNTALGSYVGDVASNIIGAITPVATTGMTIYVILWGLSMMRGLISEPLTDGIFRIVRLAVVTGLALNIGLYSSFIANALWNSPDALAAYVASGYSSGTSNVSFLDSLMSRMYDLGDAYWQKANASSGMLPIPDLGLTAIAILVWVMGVVATAYGAFLLALSKLALAILLGVGPLFVLMTMFEGTKRFFEAWIGQALNYVFLVMLTSGVIKLILTILQLYLTAAETGGVLADPKISQALPAFGICIIAMLVMMQLPSISSALGGGAAVSSLGAVGWAYGKATGTVAGMRPTALRREMLKMRSDARILNNVLGPARISRGAGGATGRAASSFAGRVGPAAQAAGYAAGRATAMPAALYRKVTSPRVNRVSQG
ncbi:type IV secretion system protein (plasmid) [Sphaerotilaceae bacterium SBD11-9]